MSGADLFSAIVYPEDKQQGDEVESSEEVLGQTDVDAVAGDVVQRREDVDEPSRVPANDTNTNGPFDSMHGGGHSQSQAMRCFLILYPKRSKMEHRLIEHEYSLIHSFSFFEDQSLIAIISDGS